MSGDEASFKKFPAGTAELPEIIRQIDAEAVFTEKSGLCFLFYSQYPVRGLLGDDKMARDNDRYRIKPYGMSYSPDTGTVAAQSRKIRIGIKPDRLFLPFLT